MLYCLNYLDSKLWSTFATPNFKVGTWPSKDDNSFWPKFYFRRIMASMYSFPENISPRSRGLRVYLVFNKSSRFIGKIQKVTSWECCHNVECIFLHFFIVIQILSFQLGFTFYQTSVYFSAVGVYKVIVFVFFLD